ncbi:MAG: regulator, partial [Woeseiaceae bacterium]
GRHLLVLDALRAPLALSQSAGCRAGVEALERDWFAPLLGALRAGRVGMVSVHVPDGGERASVETIRGDLRRFWRRRRALEHYT